MGDVRPCHERIDAAYRALPIESVEAVIERCLQEYAAAFGCENVGYGSLLSERGAYYRGLGRWADCERDFRLAADTVKNAVGTESAEYATALGNLASVLRTTGRTAEAEEALLCSLAIYEKTVDTRHLLYAGAWNSLGQLYQQTEDWARALEAHTRAAETVLQTTDDPDLLAVTWCNLANVHGHLGRWDTAETELTRAIRLYERHALTASPHYYACLNDLGVLLYTQGRYGEATETFRTALARAEAIYRADHPACEALRKHIVMAENAAGRG